jgi:hypothetical protein
MHTFKTVENGRQHLKAGPRPRLAPAGVTALILSVYVCLTAGGADFNPQAPFVFGSYQPDGWGVIRFPGSLPVENEGEAWTLGGIAKGNRPPVPNRQALLFGDEYTLPGGDKTGVESRVRASQPPPEPTLRHNREAMRLCVAAYFGWLLVILVRWVWTKPGMTEK